MGAVAAVLLLAALTGACNGREGLGASTPEEVAASQAGVDADVYAADLEGLTNEVRAEEGLDPLVESTCAKEAALERADALVGEEELKHAPLAPVIRRCAPFTTAAENLVNSTAMPPEVVDAWLGSPGHRANILDPELTTIGIGCVPDGRKLLCSQVFLGP